MWDQVMIGPINTLTTVFKNSITRLSHEKNEFIHAFPRLSR